AFQMIEGLGILPRAQVADDVKQLDQDARGALRKHGLRFGQFTIFMPLLLKPAPTRLRLVLWSLANKLDEFPEAPPPGLVTVPTDASAPEGYATMAGYRVAGERSIRIDMLERLADMLRAEDTRAGFEAKADMLSITGMTLDQFADLMQGLGYKADKGEREKQRPVAEAPADAPQVVDDSAVTATPSEPAVEGATPDGTPQPLESDETTAGLQTEEVLAEVAPEATAPETTAPEGDAPAADTPAASQDTAPEIEVFYTFTWGGGRSRRPGEQNQGGRQGRDGKRRGGDGPQGQGQGNGRRGGGKPQGAGGKKGGKGKPRDAGPKTFQSGPKRREKQIDPDNPFAAALKGLKTD
ncbi:MAG: disulfide oxidoreductase, partial [Pseudomonadota bacterium]|nr:disulfide oxidoreductase [Pseudomonadota bacterium]